VYAEGRACRVRHALGKATHNVKAFLRNVHEPKLCHGEGGCAIQKSLDKLRGVAGAATHHNNFHDQPSFACALRGSNLEDAPTRPRRATLLQHEQRQ